MKELGAEVKTPYEESGIRKLLHRRRVCGMKSPRKAIFVHGDDVISDSKESGFVEA